jgi:hypothetical protein
MLVTRWSRGLQHYAEVPENGVLSMGTAVGFCLPYLTEPTIIFSDSPSVPKNHVIVYCKVVRRQWHS